MDIVQCSIDNGQWMISECIEYYGLQVAICYAQCTIYNWLLVSQCVAYYER